MVTTLDRSTEVRARPRPRFSRDIETPTLRLPAGKKIAAVLAVALGPKGDIFLAHQPNAQGAHPGAEKLDCWLPPVVHLNSKGEYVNAWGGPNHVPQVDGVSQWPQGLEGLDCDADGNLWLFGYKKDDDAVLKFAPDGKLLLRIGQRGRPGTEDDTRYLGGSTSCYHNTETREVFISDGYRNRRIVAFNGDTGAFTRMWGAYGKKPSALSAEENFAYPVHKVVRGPGGHLYVADRTMGRIQEFEVTPNAVRFVREVVVAPGTNGIKYGPAWDVNFTPDGKFMYVADGANFRIWSVDMESFEVLGSTTVHTEYENEENLPLHYTLVHRFVVEPNGDLLMACVNRGLRRLKFEDVR